ncbi:hypothetical protein EDC04DRAFT_2602737 [Pisolithus marmoratus]|nr:hypothetical protein EDC04DRAFT_2602737 [Pisolithus marmoratus]
MSEGLLAKLGTLLHTLGVFDWLWVQLVSLFWFLCGAGDGVTCVAFIKSFLPSLVMPWSVNSYKADKLNYDEVILCSSSASPPCGIFRPTIKLPLDDLLDPCNEEMPSMPSALDTNTMTNAMGDGDITVQDLAGSSTGPSATASGMSVVGCSASSVSTPSSGNVNGNGTKWRG